MKRILLILDGTEHIDEAIGEVRNLCDAGDKLTILAVAETPSRELFGTRPRVTEPGPYVGHAGGTGVPGPSDVPVTESESEAETRAAGELRDALDERVAATQNGIEVWTQAIVRDDPSEAVADYIRQSDVTEVAVPRGSLDRLHEMLTDEDDNDALDGSLAPVIVLPA